jgi:hypothetical protein
LLDYDPRAGLSRNVAKFRIDQHYSRSATSQHRRVLRARQDAQVAGFRTVEGRNTAYRGLAVSYQLAGNKSRYSLSGDGAIGAITAD